MLIASIEKGDVAGAYWMCDILQKWWIQRDFEKGYFLKRDYFLTLDCFKKDWSTIQEQVELRGFTNHPADLPFKLFSSALYNYWVDVCTLSILLLLEWGEIKDPDVPIALRVAKNLINGELTHNEGSNFCGEIKPINSFENLLETFLRQRFQKDCIGKDSYRKDLDSLLHTAIDSLGKEMVLGRVYTISGGASLHSLASIQAFLLCLFAPPTHWVINQKLQDDIKDLGENDDEITRNIISFFNSMSQNIEALEGSKWGNVFALLKDGLHREQVEFSTVKQKTKKATDLLKTFTEELRKERIRSAKIDTERI
jgi:hypothetical protein